MSSSSSVDVCRCTDVLAAGSNRELRIATPALTKPHVTATSAMTRRHRKRPQSQLATRLAGSPLTAYSRKARRPMTALEVFAAFGARPGEGAMQDDVLHHAKRAVVDWYASLLPGAVEPPA